jgi:hypothetical protein
MFKSLGLTPEDGALSAVTAQEYAKDRIYAPVCLHTHTCAENCSSSAAEMVLYTHEQDQTTTGQRCHSDNLLTARGGGDSCEISLGNPVQMATARAACTNPKMLLHQHHKPRVRYLTIWRCLEPRRKQARVLNPHTSSVWYSSRRTHPAARSDIQFKLI